MFQRSQGCVHKSDNVAPLLVPPIKACVCQFIETLAVSARQPSTDVRQACPFFSRLRNQSVPDTLFVSWMSFQVAYLASGPSCCRGGDRGGRPNVTVSGSGGVYRVRSRRHNEGRDGSSYVAVIDSDCRDNQFNGTRHRGFPRDSRHLGDGPRHFWPGGRNIKHHRDSSGLRRRGESELADHHSNLPRRQHSQ
jgi:hypothetical protein